MRKRQLHVGAWRAYLHDAPAMDAGFDGRLEMKILLSVTVLVGTLGLLVSDLAMMHFAYL
jgi:hypothetical protein